MTDTRKQIIQIIEPYMDKTLGNGCIIRWIKPDIIDTILETSGSCEFGDYKTKRGYLDIEVNNGDFESIGHYDITAVFKYIESKSYNLHNEQLDGTLYIYKADGFDAPYLGQILYKPLHLYTNQEDTELLELLQKL